MSAVEDVAAAIAEQVRANKWRAYALGDDVQLWVHSGMWATSQLIATLHCQDASQAKRLAEMMKAPPARGVFDAMGIDPVDPLERFPSIRGKA